jgi:hypothetical protein
MFTILINEFFLLRQENNFIRVCHHETICGITQQQQILILKGLFIAGEKETGSDDRYHAEFVAACRSHSSVQVFFWGL